MKVFEGRQLSQLSQLAPGSLGRQLVSLEALLNGLSVLRHAYTDGGGGSCDSHVTTTIERR